MDINRTKPTIEEVKEWNRDKLLEWIQRKRPGLLEDDNLETFKNAFICGNVFVKHGCDVGFFRNGCNLPIGISHKLMDLVVEITGGETAGMVQKGKTQDISAVAEHTIKRKSPPDTDIVPSTKRTIATERTTKRKDPSHTDRAPPPERIRVGDSSLTINGELKYFRSGSMDFSHLLLKKGQAYFDRTRYIFTLHQLDDSILFCRPCRFGKSLTVSMLRHFHGLQYAGEHQSLYKDLDVQNDIDEGKVKPGQYFILSLDFSIINAYLPEANKALIKNLNYSIKWFYEEYTAHLGGNLEALCQGIDSEDPNVSLEECANSVRRAIENDEQLAGIEGIYLLIDEYDAFPNHYLNTLHTIEGAKITWEDTAVGRTFSSFWSTVKSLSAKGSIRRIFITGVSPLSLSSGFNVARNLSFDRNLAGLCGLRYSDVEDALKSINDDPEAYKQFHSQMRQSFDGYHFCMDETVETVYNTETCLAYLRCLIQRKTPEAVDPENSEISNDALRIFTTSASVMRDFEGALRRGEESEFMPLEYDQFKLNFSFQDLRTAEQHFVWRSLIVYFGGLTFHPKKPKTHLKISNEVAARRIAGRVLEKYHLISRLEAELQNLIAYGELGATLGCYRELMIQRDVTYTDLTEKTEADHRDSFLFCLLKNLYIVPRTEFPVIKASQENGRVDLVFQASGRLIVTEWKFYRIQSLNIDDAADPNGDELAKADILRHYTLPMILQLRFNSKEQFKQGTIGSWAKEHESRQLRDYVTGTTVKQLLKDGSVELRAYLVIIVGSRHIVLWDMDKEGNLAEPRLAVLPGRSNRQYGLGYYS